MSKRDHLLDLFKKVESQAESMRLQVNCFDIDGDDYEAFQEEYAKLKETLNDLQESLNLIPADSESWEEYIARDGDLILAMSYDCEYFIFTVGDADSDNFKPLKGKARFDKEEALKEFEELRKKMKK